ncbi:MAG: histidine--tRNA ligase [Candidatus Pacebacteria bacterium CG10_big_fil_rev_8_21_14_0_10_56_10]|nr:MAG: histidine--tRNA ligase [Candidatus Pacebacteria bacterium CG10_big_fil_rev_8_21_14_0_10_56_10]
MIDQPAVPSGTPPAEPVQNLKGFQDFLPGQMRARTRLENSIRQTFERFGFEPVETPALEYASLLLGKYGAEADRQVYIFEDRGGRRVGLRYDQTVPTARLLAQYRSQLPRYWRRYQLQDVFRTEKPQQGRYRQFRQADCDIFGSSSPLADAEILAVFYAVYADLGFDDLVIKLNDRRLLVAAVSEFTTGQTDVFSIIQSIDKLDKKEPEAVSDELVAKGLTAATVKQIFSVLENTDQSEYLAEIVDKTIKLGVPAEALVFNPRLARGLDYYTGMIFEGKLGGQPDKAVGGGSVGGGGRYDNLIEELAGASVPAVGFGIGFDRTLEAAAERGLLTVAAGPAQVMVALFEDTVAAGLELGNRLRQAGISTEIYPALDPLSKQLKVANQKRIPWVAMIGPTEANERQVTVKELATGRQQTLSLDEVAEWLSSKTKS